MPKFLLDYIDPAGVRVDDLTDGFETFERACDEATLILEEIVGGELISSPMGFIEVLDQKGACVSVISFSD